MPDHFGRLDGPCPESGSYVGTLNYMYTGTQPAAHNAAVHCKVDPELAKTQPIQIAIRVNHPPLQPQGVARVIMVLCVCVCVWLCSGCLLPCGAGHGPFSDCTSFVRLFVS